MVQEGGVAGKSRITEGRQALTLQGPAVVLLPKAG